MVPVPWCQCPPNRCPPIRESQFSTVSCRVIVQGPLRGFPLDQVVQREPEGVRLQPCRRLQQGRGRALGEKQPGAGQPGGEADHRPHPDHRRGRVQVRDHLPGHQQELPCGAAGEANHPGKTSVRQYLTLARTKLKTCDGQQRGEWKMNIVTKKV